MSEPKWLALARSELGTKELVGKGSNPKVLSYYAESGHAGVEDDATAWCAAFTGAMLARSGMPNTGSLAARSYETYGAKLDQPKVGCIGVMTRGNPKGWQGHVGFVVGFDDDRITMLGGNQSDKVCIESFPRAKFIAFRWPIEPSVKELAKVSRSVNQLKKAKDIAVIGASGSAVLGALKEGADAIVPVAPVPDPSVVDHLSEAAQGASNAKTLVDTVSGMATAISSNGWILVFVICVAVFFIATRLLGWRIEEILSGRWRPSGEV